MAAHAKLRAAIVPGRPEAARAEPVHEHTQHRARMSWTRLLKRLFDIERCPKCAGRLKIIAVIEDGKGCWRDNVFAERFWKSIKYEAVYLHAYDSVAEAKSGIG